MSQMWFTPRQGRKRCDKHIAGGDSHDINVMCLRLATEFQGNARRWSRRKTFNLSLNANCYEAEAPVFRLWVLSQSNILLFTRKVSLKIRKEKLKIVI